MGRSFSHTIGIDEAQSLYECLESGIITARAFRRKVDWVYDTAMRYKADNVPLIIMAGKDYGAGSCRDWAAKGPWLLGVPFTSVLLVAPGSRLMFLFLWLDARVQGFNRHCTAWRNCKYETCFMSKAVRA